MFRPTGPRSRNASKGFWIRNLSTQTLQSLIALGTGGWTGVGLGAGTQKLGYLPEAHTDFIFAIIGEELGFLGCVAVLLLFLVVIWSGASIAARAQDRFGFLVASGITLALGFQAVINVAVVTGSAPTKGMPLPLVSFGGSGLCMTLAQVGILMSIARISELPSARSAVGCPPGILEERHEDKGSTKEHEEEAEEDEGGHG